MVRIEQGMACTKEQIVHQINNNLVDEIEVG
jgi:hypothetical protein